MKLAALCIITAAFAYLFSRYLWLDEGHFSRETLIGGSEATLIVASPQPTWSAPVAVSPRDQGYRDKLEEEVLFQIQAPFPPRDSLPGASVAVGTKDEEKTYSETIPWERLPPELGELLTLMYAESISRNYDHVAHIGLDLLDASHLYPEIEPHILSLIGQAYESLGYTGMAMNSYQQALEIYPGHPASIKAMHRLDEGYEGAIPDIEAQGIGAETDLGARKER